MEYFSSHSFPSKAFSRIMSPEQLIDICCSSHSSSEVVSPSSFFFFQAEDGIRDRNVTGVQTCALPVPFSFKWATDALTGANTAPVQADNWHLWVIASPLLLTASYGVMRIVMAVLTQWRDGIFARVAMHAVRKLATITFIHMHELSLRFHLERKTGGLTRVLERGREGIEVIVRMVILQLIPTIVEVTLLMGVLLWQFDWRYVLAIAVMVAVYMYYTYIATEWRIEIRRKMNDSDTEANTKAIDSLLNYETVKYFSAEEREARRYDRSMERYEEASVRKIGR